MKRIKIIILNTFLLIVLSLQLNAQFIKNKDHAIKYIRYCAKDTFVISNQYYTFDLTIENEYLVFKTIKFKIGNTNVYGNEKIRNESIKQNYRINLNDSLILIKAIKKNQINSIIYKNQNLIFLKPVRYYKNNTMKNKDEELANVKAVNFIEAFNKLKSDFDPKETEEYKLAELKKGKLANSKAEISEEQRKYIVQANVANENKDYENSLELFRKANEINPYAYPAAYFNMALIHANLFNYYQAVYAMKQYLIVAPDAEDARKAQDKIYEWELNIKN